MFKAERPFFVIVTSALSLLGCQLAHAEWVEWLADASFSGQFDTNINRSFSAAQQHEDYFGKGLLSAGRAYQLSDFTRAYFSGVWDGEVYQHFEKLNQYSVGGKAAFTHKFGLGWQAPKLTAEFSGREIFSESSLRSGRQFNAGLELSSWCNDVLQGFIGYRFDDRKADANGQKIWNLANSVFDLQGHTLEIGNNLVLTDSLQMSISYSHRWGGVTSNSNTGNWQMAGLEAVVRDDAFSGWTYRAQGESNQVNLGLNYALLSGHASAGLNYSFLDTGALARNYQSHQVQVSINYSY